MGLLVERSDEDIPEDLWTGSLPVDAFVNSQVNLATVTMGCVCGSCVEEMDCSIIHSPGNILADDSIGNDYKY